MVGLDDLKGLFHPKQFYDSVILQFLLVKLQHNIHQKKKVTLILLKSVSLCKDMYMHISKAET